MCPVSLVWPNTKLVNVIRNVPTTVWHHNGPNQNKADPKTKSVKGGLLFSIVSQFFAALYITTFVDDVWDSPKSGVGLTSEKNLLS